MVSFITMYLLDDFRIKDTNEIYANTFKQKIQKTVMIIHDLFDGFTLFDFLLYMSFVNTTVSFVLITFIKKE